MNQDERDQDIQDDAHGAAAAEEAAQIAAEADAYQNGHATGYSIARQVIEHPLTWNRPSDIVAAAIEAEQNARQYSPFEHTANAYNQTPYPDDTWNQHDKGVQHGATRAAQEESGKAQSTALSYITTRNGKLHTLLDDLATHTSPHGQISEKLLSLLYWKSHHSSPVDIAIPDPERLQKEMYEAHNGKRRQILITATLNGYAGGILLQTNDNGNTWTVSAHT